ncbi:MAG: ABC transporter ATP-binding protein [Betaproteobacteria bacterium]
MLEVRGAVVGYGPVTALAGVDLSVESGEIVCVIGPNGAGKTTLMKTIAGVLRPRAGEFRFEGAALARGADARVRAGIALVPEGRRVFAPLTVSDNLEMGAYVRLARGERAAVREDMERMYGIFPRLRERATQPAGTLSGGEQQMLAIGRALMSRPRLLLLDEPSMGLSPLMVVEIFHVVRRLHAEGTTVLLAEQNAHMALSVSTRAYVIESGLVVKSAPASELADDPAVREAYLGGV